MPSEEFVFDVLDFKGRRVRLTRRTFENHLPIHPEISEYLEEAKQVISDPDGALELDNGAVVVFRYGLGRAKFEGCHLGVVVYYRTEKEGEEGVVATYHFFRRLPDGAALEHRHQWVAGQRISVEGFQGHGGKHE